MSGKGTPIATLMAGVLACMAGGAFATAAHAQAAATGVNFDDPQRSLHDLRPTLTVSQDHGARFASIETPGTEDQALNQTPAEAPRQLELEVSAPGAVTGMPLDVSIAQRASIGVDNSGDLNRHGRGSELRVGHSIGHSLAPSNRGRPDFSQHRVYMFAASDDQALTWAPGQQAGGRFALQDRVEVGDHQAGVTYERGNVQASLAYVEREISTTVGRESFSKNENFAGVTLTMRN